MNYYSADTHFCHANILIYCGRPFENSHFMDEAIIERFNSKLKPEDTLYLLGDVCLGNPNQCAALLSRIPCQIKILTGDHDRTIHNTMRGRKLSHVELLGTPGISIDKGVYPVVQIEDHEQCIILCHWSMRTWRKKHHGAWHLYGHSHGELTDDRESLSMDVGVDTHDFYPYSFDEIKERMAKKRVEPVRHK